MDYIKEDEFNNNDTSKTQSGKKIKEGILDENFKKALYKDYVKENNVKPEKKTEIKKESFLKLGILLIIISIICVAFINTLPWAYAKYDNNAVNYSEENYYYRDFIKIGGDSQENFTEFFKYGNSSKYLGLNEDDFTTIPNMSGYSLYILLAIGIFFTVLELLNRKYQFNLQKMIIIHSLALTIMAFICVFIVFINVKFIGANVLLNVNRGLLNNNLPNLMLIFPSPIFLIIASSLIMKLAFTLLKANYTRFNKILESNNQIKSTEMYRYHGGDKNKWI